MTDYNAPSVLVSYSMTWRARYSSAARDYEHDVLFQNAGNLHQGGRSQLKMSEK